MYRRFQFWKKSYWLIICLILSCCDNRKDSGFLKGDVLIIQEFSCDSYNIKFDQRDLKIGDSIGHGVRGYVYALEENNEIIDDLVLKVQAGFNIDNTYNDALEEVQLAKDLPGIYTKTYLYGLYSVKLENDLQVFRSFLIKDRINGLTLFDMIHHLDSHPEKALEVYESLLQFRGRLKTALLNQLDSESFIWDFHARNIMYDFHKKSWFIVDASQSKSLVELETEISGYIPYQRNKKHPIFAIQKLLRRYYSISRNDFVESYIDIYMKESIQAVLSKIKQAA